MVGIEGEEKGFDMSRRFHCISPIREKGMRKARQMTQERDRYIDR